MSQTYHVVELVVLYKMICVSPLQLLIRPGNSTWNQNGPKIPKKSGGVRKD